MSEESAGREDARESDSPGQGPVPPGGPQPYGPPPGPSQPYPPPFPQSAPPYPPPYPPPGQVTGHPYPQRPYPQAGMGTRAPAPAWAPPRIEPVPGTPFGLAYFSVPPTVSGQAVGGMVAGILSILVSLVVACFGLAGARQGWGPLVGGAFAVLAASAGLAAIALGWFSVRQITRSGGRLTGRGMAIAGTSCGATGLALTAVALALALVI